MNKQCGVADGLFFAVGREVNEAGRELVKSYEGLHVVPYLCPAQVWSIGYGHTRNVAVGSKVTAAQAEALLDEDLRVAGNVVCKNVTVQLNENQYAALVSFVFNVGAANFERSSLLKLLNRGWYEQVPAQLMRWNHVRNEVMGGLSRRRAAEGRLWNKPVGDEGMCAI